jgi:hypothetical protein
MRIGLLGLKSARKLTPFPHLQIFTCHAPCYMILLLHLLVLQLDAILPALLIWSLWGSEDLEQFNPTRFHWVITVWKCTMFMTLSVATNYYVILSKKLLYEPMHPSQNQRGISCFFDWLAISQLIFHVKGHLSFENCKGWNSAVQYSFEYFLYCACV